MSNSPKNNVPTESSAQAPSAPQLSEAQRILEEIKLLKIQVESILKEAELAAKNASSEAALTATAKKSSEENTAAIANAKAVAEANANAIATDKQKSDETLAALAATTKNAGSEALLAFNAKEACEKHATTIAGVKGTVEADATAISTNKQRSDEALLALNTGKATVDADMKLIEGRRKEVDQSATAIEGRRKEVDQSAIDIIKAAEAGAARLREVEASKEAAASALKATSDSAKAASEAASGADLSQKAAEKSTKDAAESAAVISENQKATSQTVEETKALLALAQTTEANLKKVAEHLAKSDEIATGHEQRVEALKAELQNLMVRVEGLLPGATSAGLASSFSKQRSRFLGPQKLWLLIFVGCIVMLVATAVPSFLSAVGWSSHPMDPSWTAAWRSLTLRLPIVLPLVWLAIYAGRNYMMSLRMEEDYAYKEAISTAFEGYKREMEKIAAGDGGNPTPTTILCSNILRAIAERPGRIYEGKQKDINLLTELQELGEKGAELSKKKLATR
jgi:hypothetical protein